MKALLIAALSTAFLATAPQALAEGASGKPKGDRPSPEEIFNKLDADQSGGLSKEEAKGPMAKHFEKIDQDGDGEISPKELKQARKKMAANKKQNQNGERGEKFEQMDTDGNGTISKAEAGERLLEHFDTIDTNGDGELSKDELKAAAQNRREKRGQK